MTRFPIRLAALALALAGPALALGPHEVALLVSRQSEASLEVASHYARLRQIPPANIILVDVPEAALGEAAEIGWEDFQRAIREPVDAEIRRRGIGDHILAWVYAPGFPVRVTSAPALSLQGATFLRGQPPDAAAVRSGQFHSPLYAGPDRPQGPFAESHSLEFFAASLRDRMPLPSMLLGVAGARGQSAAQIVDQLKIARSADATAPRAPVWFATNGDIRATARGWEFPDAAKELEQLGVPARLSPAPPERERELGGLMLGQRTVEPLRYGPLAAGAVADHLTSFAGAFHFGDQSKLTAWLAHGAAAAAGTVVEPTAAWTKFPHARLFAHIARGCTLLEGYAQAVRSPMELLVVGDPLCAPHARPVPLSLALLGDGDPDAPVSNRVEFAAAPVDPAAAGSCEFLYLLDGRALADARGEHASVDTRTLADGWHDLRAVCYRDGAVRHQSFALRGFEVRNAGRAVRASLPGRVEAVDLDHPVRIQLDVQGEPAEVALVAQERVVARSTNRGDRVLLLNPRLLGAGPQRVQAVAVYSDRMAVRSPPLDFVVRRLNHPPTLEKFTWTPAEAGFGHLGIEADDAEHDGAFAVWGERLDADEAGRARFEVAGATTESAWDGETLTLKGGQPLALCRVAGLTLSNALRWAATVQLPACADSECAPACGLAFNIRGPRTFDGFGWFGQSSSWAFFRVVDGAVQRTVTRGAPERPGAWVEVAVQRTPAGLEAEVDGAPLCRWEQAAFADVAAGVFAGAEASSLRNVRVFPPVRGDVELTKSGLRCATGADVRNLLIRLSDGRASSETPARRP